MPIPKHKPTTSSPEGSSPQSAAPIAPDQEEFRQHLRRLAVSTVQVLIDEVLDVYSDEQLATITDFLTRATQHAREVIATLNQAVRSPSRTRQPSSGVDHGR